MASEIRKLSIDDYEAIINVWADAGLPYRPDGRDARGKMEREIERPDTAFFGLFENGRMVAVGLATFDGRKGWINRVAVDPERRHRGYGSQIIRACECFLKDRGAHIIACLIEEYNTPSMALFRKLGYDCGEGIYYFSRRESEDT